MRSYLVVAFAFFIVSGCSKPAQVSGDLVFIEGGSFVMGNRYDTADPDESYLHEVRVGSYYFGRHEVTVGQFRKFAENSGYVTTAERLGNASVFIGKKVARPGDGSWKKPYFKQHDRHPVVCVSWWDAIAYCNWRSSEEGLDLCYDVGPDSTVIWNREADGYRLATEAEWEYAGRSRGMDVRYAWGDSIPIIDGKSAGNTLDEAAHRQWEIKNYWEGYDDGYAWTAPVDTFSPNISGIHGISGNVYEWCWDWYSDWYKESPVDDPIGPSSGNMRACRDAGFGCPIYQEVVSSRGKGFPYLAFSWGGFRVARSIRK